MDKFAKRLVTALLAVVLLIYVGYQAYSIWAPTIETAVVQSYQASETVDTTGFVIRSEMIVTQQVDGYVSYMLEDGGRVSKGGAIAQVFPSENAALLQQSIDLLDEEIRLLQEINSPDYSSHTSLSVINRQLDEQWMNLLKSIRQPPLSDLRNLYADMLYLLNKQQFVVGKTPDFSARIEVLTAQKAALETQAAAKGAQIASPVAGYFVSKADGYEDAISLDNVAQLSPADIEAAQSRTPGTIPEDAVGKVVGDYEWYLACVVSLEESAYLPVDKSLTVRFPFVSTDAVPIKVVAVNKDASGKVAVILKCTYMSKELSSIRKEPVQIEVNEYTGLRVPDEALQFRQDAQTGGQESGVFIRTGNTLSFRKVQVLYHNEKDGYSICEVKTDSGYLKLYDTMVIGGKNLYDGKIVR